MSADDAAGPTPAATDGAADAQSDGTIRDRLIDVTMEMLASNGEQALRVVEVADAAGVSMGTIYTHFENRRALVAAVRLEQYRRWMLESLRQIREALDGLDGPSGAVGTLGQLVIRPDDPVYRSHRELRIDAIAASHHEPELAEEMQQLQREMNGLAQDLVRRAQTLGIIDPAIDPAAMALLLQAVPMGLLIADLDPESAPSSDAWVELLVRVGAALMGSPGAD
jgi:AcrR family transcriptional regulator